VREKPALFIVIGLLELVVSLAAPERELTGELVFKVNVPKVL